MEENKNGEWQRKLEYSLELLLQYEKCGGLLPVVVQDALTRDVLMLGYASEEAFAMTMQTGFATFWSRSMQCLWTKGMESGNRYLITDVFVDCDQDSIVYLVDPEKGGICHTKDLTGEARRSCFYRRLNPDLTMEYLPGME